MRPAFHIPLTEDELRTLGEIAAIQGQIEFFMSRVAALLLGLPPGNASLVLGTTSAHARAKAWRAITDYKIPDGAWRERGEAISAEYIQFTQRRNDLIHGLFAYSLSELGGILIGPNEVTDLVADRVNFAVKGSRRDTQICELQDVRDQAARLTHELNKLWQALVSGEIVRYDLGSAGESG